MRPCIIIPGIQGSALQNVYPLSPASTWSTLTIISEKFTAPDFDSLALDDTATADRAELVVTLPSQLLAIAYGPLAAALQGRLGVPAYLFPYDWRYSIVQSAQALVQYVNRLKLKSMPTVVGWDGLFDFAVHSMGGLVLRAFLDAWQRANGAPIPVGQICFIATPHLGAVDAAVALISGESPMFGGHKELRKLARTFPAVYELLPRFLPAPVVRTGAALDIFDVNNWQKNTVDPDVNNSGFDVEQFHLTAAKRVLTTLPLPSDAPFKIDPNDQLVIFGNKPNSVLVSVEVGPAPDCWYDFDNAAKGPGDDVVPVQSAQLAGVSSVEIQVDDVSYFHPVERGMASSDLHAFLPALDETATIVSRFFQGQRGVDLLPKGLPAARFHP